MIVAARERADTDLLRAADAVGLRALETVGVQIDCVAAVPLQSNA